MWKSIHKQIAQLRVKPVEPHRDQMLRLEDISIYFRLLAVSKSIWSWYNLKKITGGSLFVHLY